MSVIRNPLMNPWKDASRSVGGEDESVALYVKCIADEGLASGSQADQATVTVSGSTVTFQIAEDGGSLANDTGISYTSAAGADGTITLGDTNADSIQEVANIINGVGVGQTAFRRWRAAIGDRWPGYALTTGDFLTRAATNALLGRFDEGVELFLDGSALASADDVSVGIGTSGGTIPGSGWILPDYFEDIPGSSTVASVNTPLRSSASIPRKAHEAVTRRKQFRITGWSFAGDFDTTQTVTIYDIDGNTLWTEATTAGSAITFQDRSESPIVGPIGSPLFLVVSGTGTFTDGALSVRAEERFV